MRVFIDGRELIPKNPIINRDSSNDLITISQYRLQRHSKATGISFTLMQYKAIIKFFKTEQVAEFAFGCNLRAIEEV